MIEDKLTHEERLRLECTAQAVSALGPLLVRVAVESPGDLVVAVARVIEGYVAGAPVP